MGLDSASYPEVQDMLAAQQVQIDRLSTQLGATQAAQGGFADLAPIGPWPTSVSVDNGRVVVVLRTAIPSTTSRLKMVIEQYTGSGSPVTVIDRITTSDIEVSDEQRLAGQGDFVFPQSLVFDGQFGLIKLVSIDFNGNRVVNPDPVFPDSPRNESDYLITFVTPVRIGGAGVPSMPTFPRVISNLINPTGDGTLGFLTLRTFANEAETLTFGDQHTVGMQLKLVQLAGGHTQYAQNIDDPTILFVDFVAADLQVGATYSWVKNTAIDEAGLPTVAPAVASIDIIVGHFADPGDGLANLTFVNMNPNILDNGATIRLKWRLHQPNPAYRLLSYFVERKLSSEPDSAYTQVVGISSLLDPQYSTPGDIIIIDFVSSVPASSYIFRLTITSFESVGLTPITKQFTSGTVASGPTTLSAAISATSGSPSLVPGGSLLASRADYGVVGETQYPGLLWRDSAMGGTKIDNLAPGGGGSWDLKGVRWKNTEGRISIATNVFTLGGKIAVRVGKPFLPGNVVVICPLFRADTADVTIDIIFALVDETSGDIVVETATGVVISHTEQTLFYAIMVVPTTYVVANKQNVELRFNSNPSQILNTTNWQLSYGSVYRSFVVDPTEASLIGAAGITSHGEGETGSTEIVIVDANGFPFSVAGNRSGRIVLQ